MDKTFKVSVLFDERKLLAYEVPMLEMLLKTPGIDTQLHTVDSVVPTDKPTTSSGYRLYRWLDKRIFDMGNDPFEAAAASPAITHNITNQSLAEDRPDIVIAMSAVATNAAQLNHAGKFGVVFIDDGNPISNEDSAEYWDVLGHQAESKTTLKLIQPDGKQTIIGESSSATDAISPIRNRCLKYWKAGSLLIKALNKFQHTQSNNIEYASRNEIKDVQQQHQLPGSFSTFKQLIQHTPKIFQFYQHAKLTREQWYLRFQFSDQMQTDIESFHCISPPDDRIWADPHAIVRNGKYYIFVEEMLFSENKGFISVIELSENGNYSQPVKVLERDFHLSYPQLIEYNDQLYMLPEASASNHLTLYRCVDFPHHWEEKAVIMDNIAAFDASLLYHQGKWWLFTNLRPHPLSGENDELHLFYSDELLSGTWTPHPLNPIISDVKKARPAGEILHINDQLIRPSQDCSQHYGFGFNLNQITELSETQYEEKVITKKTAALFNQPTELGTHTFVRKGNLTMIDACRRIPRFS